MKGSALLGKTELLAWAAEVTGVMPCSKYGDLRDGLVYVELARQLFPNEIDTAAVRLQRRGARDPGKNWALLLRCLRRHGIPPQLCDRKAVERGHARYCFNLLVLFYFLLRLAGGEQFAVDFAQPVDPQLAAFLQSPESVLAVERRVDLNGGSGGHLAALPESDAVAQDNTAPAFMHLSSPSMTATASLQRCEAGGRNGKEAADVLLSDNTTARNKWSAPPLQQVLSRTGDVVETPRPRLPLHPLSSVQGVRHAADGGEPSDSYATIDTHLGYLPKCIPPESEPATGLLPSLAATSLITAASSASPAHAENALLKEELLYAKAVIRLLVEQHRASAVAAETRAAVTLKEELAKAELDHLGEIRQLQVAVLVSSHNADSSSRSFSPPQWMALRHRAETAEATAARVYHASHENQQVYDATLETLRCALHAIAEVTTSTLLSTSSGDVDADEGEVVVTTSMMGLLSGMPDVVRSAVHAQLQALLLSLKDLRTANARLRRDIEAQRHGHNASDEDDDATRAACSWEEAQRHFQSPFREACAEAQQVCQSANPAVQRMCGRLLRIIDVLQGNLCAAQRDRDTWEKRCRREEVALASAKAELHQSREQWEAQGRHDSEKRSITTNTQWEHMLHVVREGRERAEKFWEEAERVYRRVEDLLTATFSTPGTQDMTWASDQLASMLKTWMKMRRPHTAMEKAMSEQADTIAALRIDLRRHREALEQTEKSAEDGEDQLQTLRRTCARLQAQLRGTEEQLAIQRADAHDYAETLHKALLEKGPTAASRVTCSEAQAQPFSALGEGLNSTPHLNSSVFHDHRRKASCSAAAAYLAAHPPGTLRSPSPSDEELDRRARSRTAPDRSCGQGEEYDDDTVSPLRAPSISAASSSVSAAPTAPSAQVGAGLLTMATTESKAAVKTSTSEEHERNLSKTAEMGAATSSSSLLLSASELARRKEAILRKYGVL